MLNLLIFSLPISDIASCLMLCRHILTEILIALSSIKGWVTHSTCEIAYQIENCCFDCQSDLHAAPFCVSLHIRCWWLIFKWPHFSLSYEGMMMRPMPDVWTKLIRFEQGIRSTYKIYTDHIQAFLDRKFFTYMVDIIHFDQNLLVKKNSSVWNCPAYGHKITICVLLAIVLDLVHGNNILVSLIVISLENFVSIISEYENDKQVGENFIDCSKGKTEFQQKKVNISWFIIPNL